eukprot:1422146-Rhodomonas_salina.1
MSQRRGYECQHTIDAVSFASTPGSIHATALAPAIPAPHSASTVASYLPPHPMPPSSSSSSFCPPRPHPSAHPAPPPYPPLLLPILLHPPPPHPPPPPPHPPHHHPPHPPPPPSSSSSPSSSCSQRGPARWRCACRRRSPSRRSTPRAGARATPTQSPAASPVALTPAPPAALQCPADAWGNAASEDGRRGNERELARKRGLRGGKGG